MSMNKFIFQCRNVVNRCLARHKSKPRYAYFIKSRTENCRSSCLINFPAEIGVGFFYPGDNTITVFGEIFMSLVATRVSNA